MGAQKWQLALSTGGIDRTSTWIQFGQNAALRWTGDAMQLGRTVGI